MEPLLTVLEVAAALKIPRKRVYVLKEQIGFVAIGSRVRFRPEDLAAYIERCRRPSSRATTARIISPAVLASVERPSRDVPDRRFDRRVEKMREQLRGGGAPKPPTRAPRPRV